ncbi:hypothetical protein C8Q75DRAFT_774648 [Abortiporus biennis]|nr:hypothetical protein C8Q75DRAFT_774648 [Abortiporus biennis]
MARGLTSLPSELLQQILSELNGTEIARCSTICHSVHNIVLHSQRLQYLIQLQLAGMVDIQSNCSNTATKLAMIRNYSTAAFCPKPQYMFVQKVPYVRCYAERRFRSSEVEVLFAHGILAQRIMDGPKNSMIYLCQLPSEMRQVPSREWRLELVIPPLLRLRRLQWIRHKICCSQSFPKGLYKVYGSAFSIFTGLTHPLASPKLEDVILVPESCHTSVSICGDEILIFADWEDERDDEEIDGPYYLCKSYQITIFNWRTGDINVAISVPSYDSYRMSKELDVFTLSADVHEYEQALFLDQNHIAIATVIHDNCDFFPTASINTIDIQQLRRTQSILDSTVSFELPTPEEGMAYLATCSITCGHPGAPGFEVSSLSPTQFPQPPFGFESEDTILAFNWSYSLRYGSQAGPYSGFIPISRLLSLYPREVENRKKKRIPWVEWGPLNTRVLHKTLFLDGMVYGSRALICQSDGLYNDELRSLISVVCRKKTIPLITPVGI